MKTNPTRALFRLVGLVALCTAGAADAEYKCTSPTTPLDRRACAAAQQSPAALRHFLQRMQSIESLYFYDYMTDAQLLAWRAAQVDAARHAHTAEAPSALAAIVRAPSARQR